MRGTRMSALCLMLVLCACSANPFEGRHNVNSGNGNIDGKKAITTDMQFSVGEVDPFDEGNLEVLDMSGREILRVDAVANDTKRQLKALSWSKDSSRFAALYSDYQGTEAIVHCTNDASYPCGRAEFKNIKETNFHYLTFSNNLGFVLISTDGSAVEELPIIPISPAVIVSPPIVNEVELDGGTVVSDSEIVPQEMDGLVIEVDSSTLKN
ncbi:MAG: hypothetical protein WC663_05040 [Patescibacteria group bacterium]